MAIMKTCHFLLVSILDFVACSMSDPMMMGKRGSHDDYNVMVQDDDPCYKLTVKDY